MLHPGHPEDTLCLIGEEDWRCYAERCVVPQTGGITAACYSQASLAPLRGSALEATAAQISSGILDSWSFRLQEFEELPIFQSADI